MAAPRTLTFVPRPARWPWLERRLRHAVELGSPPLNEEAIAIGYLYQHASTARRRQLYEFLRVNDCECLGCQRKTRSLAEIFRDWPGE